MKWQMPTLLGFVCTLTLLISIGFLRETTDFLGWLITFGAVLLSGFGLLTAVVWLFTAANRQPKLNVPPVPSVSQSLPSNTLQQSEFARQWSQRRNGVTYDENVRMRREAGQQLAQPLKLPTDTSHKTRNVPGFRDINDPK
jgi:hypothetical protein